MTPYPHSGTVAVTGAAGVVGAAIVAALAARGTPVVGIDLQDAPDALAGTLGSDDWVRVDITDWERLFSALEGRGITAAVHSAAMVTHTANRNPRAAVAVNLGGTANMLDLVRLNGWQGLVYISSRVVYGKVAAPYCHPDYRPVPEDHPLAPLSMYATTKVCAEQLCRKFASDYGFTVACLRSAAIYGPGKNEGHGATSFLSHVIEAAAEGQRTEVSGGEQCEDFVYMKDVAGAAVAAVDFLKRGEAGFHAFHIGAGHGTSLAEFAGVVSEQTGTEVPVAPGIGMMGRDSRQSFVLDQTRTRNILGFTPEFDLRSGIEDYVSGMKTSQPISKEREGKR